MRELWNQHSNKLIRFSLVGLSNMLISYSVFNIILSLINIAYIAQAVSFSVAVIWSFTINSIWTFKQSTYQLSQFYRFLTLQGSLLVFSSITLGITVDFLSFEHNISWLVTMIIVTIVNYYMSHYWVFRVQTEVEHIPEDLKNE